MIVPPARAGAFCAEPPASLRGVLFHGSDESLGSERRRALLEAMLGPQAEAEMRLTALSAGDLRADPSALSTALRAFGFFPGRRAVWLADATDAQADAISAALAEATTPDSVLVVTAGALTARSGLRKLFESARDAAAIAGDSGPPNRAELAEGLRARDLPAAPEALAALDDLAQGMEAGPFARLLDLLALYKHGDASPLDAADVAACAPAEIGAEIGAVVLAIVERRPEALRTALTRLFGQGVAPTTLAIGLGRAMTGFHAIRCGGQPGDAVLGRLRPFIGDRRGAIATALARWSPAAIETALASVHDLDAALRGGSPAPARALTERTLLRLAMSPER